MHQLSSSQQHSQPLFKTKSIFFIREKYSVLKKKESILMFYRLNAQLIVFHRGHHVSLLLFQSYHQETSLVSFNQCLNQLPLLAIRLCYSNILEGEEHNWGRILSSNTHTHTHSAHIKKVSPRLSASGKIKGLARPSRTRKGNVYS